MKKGVFITLEGGEGSGKSTQIRRLAAFLQGQGHDVVTTREPGGTPEAEKIRDLLVRRDGGRWTPMAESLLFFAARTMHVDTLIKPALAQGKIVISDRFADSTRVYQACGHGLPRQAIEDLYKISLGDFAPDITFILDVPAETGLARSGRRLQAESSGEDKFESLGLDFHQRLRNGYLDIAARDPDRCIVIDAAGDTDTVARSIEEKVTHALQ